MRATAGALLPIFRSNNTTASSLRLSAWALKPRSPPGPACWSFAATPGAICQHHCQRRPLRLSRRHQLRRGRRSRVQSSHWRFGRRIYRPRFTCVSCDRHDLVEQSCRDHSWRNLRANPRRGRARRRAGNETKIAQNNRCLCRRYGIAASIRLMLRKLCNPA